MKEEEEEARRFLLLLLYSGCWLHSLSIDSIKPPSRTRPPGLILSYSLGPPFVTPYALTLNRLSLLRGVCVCVCVRRIGRKRAQRFRRRRKFTGKTHTAHHLRRIDPTLYTIRIHSKKKNAFLKKPWNIISVHIPPQRKATGQQTITRALNYFDIFPQFPSCFRLRCHIPTSK